MLAPGWTRSETVGSETEQSGGKLMFNDAAGRPSRIMLDRLKAVKITWRL